MAEVLVLVEHADGTVKKVTLELLTAARGARRAGRGRGRRARHRRGAERHSWPSTARRRSTSPSPTTSTSYLVAPKATVLAGAGRAGVAGRGAASPPPGGQGDRRPAGGQDRHRRPHRRGRRSTPTARATQSIFGGAIIVKSKVTTGIADHHACGRTRVTPSRRRRRPQSRSRSSRSSDAAQGRPRSSTAWSRRRAPARS